MLITEKGRINFCFERRLSYTYRWVLAWCALKLLVATRILYLLFALKAGAVHNKKMSVFALNYYALRK